MSLACLSDRVAVVMDEFQGIEEDVVYRVARLVKMCWNRSRVDKMVVIKDGAAMFPKAFI